MNFSLKKSTSRVFGRKLLARKFAQNAQMVASVSVSGFLENGANLRCGSNHVFTKFLFARNVFCAQNAEMRKIPITFDCKIRNCSKIQFHISCKMRKCAKFQFLLLPKCGIARKSNSAFHAKSGIAWKSNSAFRAKCGIARKSNSAFCAKF